MERLTMKTPDGYMLLDSIDIVNNKYSKINFDKVTSELGYYEDLAEQGRLVELPCKVGDTVWCIFEGKVYKGKAERFAYWHDTIDGDYVNIDVTYNIIDPFYTDGRLMRRCDPKRYGNRVFLTREEAEQALKQIGE